MHSNADQRTVLFIAYHFPPRGERIGLRTSTIATNLGEYGWKSLVLTCSPDGTTPRDEGWAQQLEEQGVEIYRTKAFRRVPTQADGSIKLPSPRLRRMSRWLKQWMQQPDVFIAWRTEALRMAEQIMRDHYVNIICAAAPPFSDFLIAQEIGQKFNVPFAIDYGDIWVDNPDHIYPTPFHREKVRAMEETLLKQSAMIFTPTRATKEDILRRHRFLTHEEIAIAPHGFDGREFPQHIKPDAHNGFVMTHYGDFANGESPKYVLTALKNLRAKREDIRAQFTLRIAGLVRNSHRKLLRKWELQDCVQLLGATERNAALQHVMESNVLWLNLAEDSPAGSAYLGDYFGARKPIFLTSPAGSIRTMAMDSKAAFACDGKDVATIQKTLEELFDAWKRNALPHPNEQYLAQFDRAAQAKEVSRHLGMSMRL